MNANVLILFVDESGCGRHAVRVLLLVLAVGPAEKVSLDELGEHADVHGGERAEAEEGEGDVIHGQQVHVGQDPEDHPGDDDDAEGDEGGHVEDGDRPEGPRAPVHVRDHHQLPDVEKDGVQLQHHADRRAPNVLSRVKAGKKVMYSFIFPKAA